MSTLVLTRSEIGALLGPTTLLGALRQGFITATQNEIPPQRARTDLPHDLPHTNPPHSDSARSDASTTVLFPGLLSGIPAYSVKMHAEFPGETPAVRGLIGLFDLGIGALLALLDSGYLTALRTAAAGAVAADALARADASHVALIGAGTQNAWALTLLSSVRHLRTVTVYDAAPLKTGPFVRRLALQTEAKLVPTDSLAEALEGADIVVTATWARAPFLYPEMLTGGAHVTTLGADEPGKAEVSAELLRESRFFCDDRLLAVATGAIGNVGLGDSAISGELGEVLSGAQPGRLADEITIYGGVGLAWMDLVAAWSVYRTALDAGVGTALDLLA